MTTVHADSRQVASPNWYCTARIIKLMQTRKTQNLLNHIRHLSDFILQEFDMIGLFGTQSACRSSSTFTNATAPPTTAFKSKSRATNMLLDNQINEKLKEVNNNLIKKRPHFLKFFNENFFKPGSAAIDGNSNGSPENSCKRWELLMLWLNA